MKFPTTLRSGYLLPALRRERNPSEAKHLRFHPRAYARGISRRGINVEGVLVFKKDVILIASRQGKAIPDYLCVGARCWRRKDEVGG